LKGPVYQDVYNVFFVTNGVLYFQEGAGMPVVVTSNKVLVDSLIFTRIEMAGAKDGVRVDITLSYNSDKPELAFSKNLISVVNRVSAITFDSDILPDVDNSRSVGDINQSWKNGYFSGNLSVEGNETLTGDLTVDTNTFYINSASNYVGIGTASPGEKLEVSGNIKFGDTIYNSYSWSPTSPNLVPDPYFNDMTQWTGESGNSLESVLLPTGEYAQSLKITTTGDVGVYSNYIPVDPEKTYRVSLWIKSDNATAGTRYLGFACYNSAKSAVPCYTSAGATTTNAYFWSGDLTANTFYKKTGYLFGYNTANSWTNPGDTATTNFRLASDVGYIKVRFLNYYNAGTSVINWFALPTVEEVQSTNREWAIKDNGDIVSLASGNVGIGTTSLSEKLTVSGNIDLPITNDWRYIKNSAASGGLRLGTGNGSGVYTNGIEISSAGGYVKLNHNTTVTGQLTTTGNVGIGTTSPGSKLTVMSDVNSSWLGAVNTSNTSANAEGMMSGQVNGTNWAGVAGRSSASNAAGIFGESSSANGYAVYCNATANANGCGGNRAWFNASDSRLKENIVTIPDALNKVLHLRGVTFNWIDGHQQDMGFIAQEVLPYVPEVVSVDNTGYYGMKTGSLTGLLVEAVKEQQKQIEELKLNNEQLRSQMEILKTR
jgi:hypothetical protein